MSGSDSYIVKYSTTGVRLWAQPIATTGPDLGWGVAVDTARNVYVSGTRTHCFLFKYDQDGNYLWEAHLGTSWSDVGYGVAVDAAGNAYMAGKTRGDIAAANAGLDDAFLAKYDAAGNLVWSRQIGTSETDYARSVAVDAAGDIYIAGTTGGALVGPQVGGADTFLVKYDPGGNVLWSRQFGSTQGASGSSVAVDSAGNVFVSGRASADMMGNTSAGSDDIFLVKFDSAGNLLWGSMAGTDQFEFGDGLAVDPAGNVYAAGATWGNLGGPNSGDYDPVLIKFTVPEPASVILLLPAGLGLLKRRSNIRPATAGRRGGRRE